MTGRDSSGTGHVPAFLLGALFLCSGALGLVDEVVWFRLLFLRLGGTGLSVATVTAAFMTGLGLGAWLFGRIRHPRHHPVAVYGFLEIGIGVYALLVPGLVETAEIAGTALMGADVGGGFPRLARFVLAGVVLVPPTVAMGATLPVLARLAKSERLRPGRFVGVLYGLNTVGAVLGAGLAGFHLLPTFGLTSTLRGAALASIVLGGVAILAARRGASARDASGPPRSRTPTPTGADREEPALAVLAYGVSGLIAFALQVAWTRILALVFASSVYAFALILVIFLSGLGVGGLAGARVGDRMGSPRRALAWCFLAVAAAVILGQGLIGRLPDLYLESLLGSGGRPVLGGAAWLAAALMFPATFLLGAGFPLAIRLATGDRTEAASRRVGGLYAANTAGGVAGAFLAALYLIPALGLAGTVTAAAFLAGAVALVLHPRGGRAGMALPAALAAVVALWALVIPAWNPLVMSNSVAFWGSHIAEGTPESMREDLRLLRDGEAGDLLFYRDGVTATVSVVEQRSAGDAAAVNRYITSDGKVDASSVRDMPTQVLLGQLPMFLHPDPPPGEDHDALVVGLASGVTAGSVLLHDLDHLDIAEIEPAMIEAYAFFDAVNRRPLQDERTRLILDDARAWLRRTEARYDVIISEPSSAWLSGPAKLFTREAFQLFHDRLEPGGVLCQWMQTYDLDGESVAAMLRTLADVFGEVVVFRSADPSDLIVLASDSPIRWRPGEVAGAWREDAAIRAELRRGSLEGPCGLAELLVAEPGAVRAVVGDGPLNTDDNAYVEHRGPRTLASGTGIVERLLAASAGPVALLGPSVPRTPAALSGLAASCLADGALRAAGSLAGAALTAGPDARALWVAGEVLRRENRRTESLMRFEQALALDPAHGPSAVGLATTLQAQGRYADAVIAWNRAAALVGEDALVLSQRGAARLEVGDTQGAIRDLERAAAMPDRPPVAVEVTLARALEAAGRGAEGRVWLESYVSGTEALTASGVAARERLGRLIGLSRPRGRQLLEQAAAARGPVAAGIAQQARELLATEGEDLVRVFLERLCKQDPGLYPALLKALHEEARADDARLAEVLRELGPRNRAGSPK